jgi:hypothetical protein
MTDYEFILPMIPSKKINKEVNNSFPLLPPITLEKRIKTLPIKIQRYIYKEFIQTEYYYLIFLQRIQTYRSESLNIVDIRPLLPILLSDQKIVDYLCKYAKCNYGNNCFSIVYKNHKIENHKDFVNMTKGDSFAQSLLMYYHH